MYKPKERPIILIYISGQMSLEEIRKLEPQCFDDMVKIVIDRKLGRVAINMEMHSDPGIELYDAGSDERDLSGANIYYSDHHIEWSSTLNIKQNRIIQNALTAGLLQTRIQFWNLLI